jgi:hypothetical protein
VFGLPVLGSSFATIDRESVCWHNLPMNSLGDKDAYP